MSALESYLDLLLARARYGRKLSALGHLIYDELQKIRLLESDRSVASATRKRLIRQCDSFIGKIARKAAKLGKTREVANVLEQSERQLAIAQPNQDKVFRAYRAVLRRCRRPPTFPEWLAEDLKGRNTEPTTEFKARRDLVLREMANRFKLPHTPVS